MNFGNYITQNSCPKSKAAQMIRGVPRGVAKRKTAIVATKLPTMWPRGKRQLWQSSCQNGRGGEREFNGNCGS